MSVGIYFVYTDIYKQCWISTSGNCALRMRLVKNILQDDEAQCYFIQTMSLAIANDVYAKIRKSLRDYADVNNGKSSHWYNLESLQAGRFIQQVEQYVTDQYTFPPYEDSESSEANHKRRKNA